MRPNFAGFSEEVISLFQFGAERFELPHKYVHDRS